MILSEILECVKKRKHVFCYGAGIIGRICAAYLYQEGISIDGFVVTKLYDNQSVMGKCIYTLDDALKKHSNAYFIVSVAAKHRIAIEDYLKERGIKEYFFLSDEMIRFMRQHNHYKSFDKGHKEINVLMYHRVNLLTNYAYQLSITPEEFEEELRYLKENYAIISSEDDWEIVTEKSVVLTFDDGYVDFYKYAFPLLCKYEIPATVFVSTAHIENGREFFWDIMERIIFSTLYSHATICNRKYYFNSEKEKRNACFEIRNILMEKEYEERRNILDDMALKLGVNITSRDAYKSMSIEELKELAQSPYVTIGGHTVTHSALSKQDAESQRWEIESSKEYLEKLAGCAMSVFSYPFGDYNDSAVNIVKQCGYKKAFTVSRGLVDGNVDNYLIPRNTTSMVKELGFPQFLDECWGLYG